MVVFAIAVCVWLYLNIQTSMQVSAQKAQIQHTGSQAGQNYERVVDRARVAWVTVPKGIS